MSSCLNFLRRTVLLTSFLFLTRTIFAQIEFKNPIVGQTENSFISIGKITVTPNSMIFHLEFEGGKAWKLFYNPAASHFFGTPYLSIQGLREFSLTDGTRPAGVPATSYELYNGPRKLSKPIKNKSLTVVFPFNSSRMLFNIFNNSYTKYDNSLLMDFIECAPKNPVKDWSPVCINFRNVWLPFTNKQLHLLYLQNYLNNELKKQEFETTADFQKRTHPDSLLKGLTKKFDNFEDVFSDQMRQRISPAKPTVVYNADLQQFTLTYAGLGLDPVIIRVPLDKAEEFKNNLQSGSLKLHSTEFVRRTDKDFYIHKIIFTENRQNQQAFDNLYGKNQSEDWKKSYFQEVLKELAKLYPKGKLWGNLK